MSNSIANNDLFVFSSVGSRLNAEYKKSVYDSWEVKKYNSGCVCYDNSDKFNYAEYFKTVIDRQGYKFPNFFYFNSIHNILNTYKYIAILDDDLLFQKPNSLDQSILLMEKYKLMVYSLSNINEDKKSYYSIMSSLKTTKYHKLYLTNFCEMGCMILHTDMMKIIEDQYYKYFPKLTDWGFDWLICTIADAYKYNIGISKFLSFSNPTKEKRDVGRKDWLRYKSYIRSITPKTYRKINVKL